MRSCRELWEKGMYAELGAYRCQVFLDFSVLRDDDKGRWSGLAAELSGRGVPSLDAALRERELRPLRESFRALLECAPPDCPPPEAKHKYAAFLDAALPFSAGRLHAPRALALFEELFTGPSPKKAGGG